MGVLMDVPPEILAQIVHIHLINSGIREIFQLLGVSRSLLPQTEYSSALTCTILDEIAHQLVEILYSCSMSGINLLAQSFDMSLIHAVKTNVENILLT